jgi:acyl-CoA reductase-like NAD-dependent aldehyde dehydrogenase
MAKHQPPEPSPERRALAQAIAHAADATRRRAALAAAKETASAAVSRARREVEEASALVETTAIGAADHLVAAAMGNGADRPPPSIRQARGASDCCR